MRRMRCGNAPLGVGHPSCPPKTRSVSTYLLPASHASYPSALRPVLVVNNEPDPQTAPEIAHGLDGYLDERRTQWATKMPSYHASVIASLDTTTTIHVCCDLGEWDAGCP